MRGAQQGASEHALAPPVHLGRLVGGATAVVSMAGAVAEVGYYRFGLRGRVAELLSLSFEQNLPTWYASCLLFACGVLVLAVARRVALRGGPFRWRWTVLGVLFVYMSLDEAVELHEQLGGLVCGTGVLYFDWVVPASVFVAVVGLWYLPFLRHLSPTSRRRFVVAGVVYVGGALLMELPLGWWTERHGTENLGYAVIDWVEETLELVGASLFAVAVFEHLRTDERGRREGAP